MSNILIATLWYVKAAKHGGVRSLNIGVYAAGFGCAAIRAKIVCNDGTSIVHNEVSGNPAYTMEVIDSLREACGV